MSDYNEYNKGNKGKKYLECQFGVVGSLGKTPIFLLIFLLSNIFMVDFRLSVNFLKKISKAELQQMLLFVINYHPVSNCRRYSKLNLLQMRYS